MKQRGDIQLSPQWDFMCLGCSLNLRWSLWGKLLFFVSRQRVHGHKRGTRCARSEVLLWFTLLSSRLQFRSQATNARGNLEENPDVNWKFTGRVSSQITAFQPNFYFSVLRLAKQSSGNVAFTRRRITTVILLEKLRRQNSQKAALRDRGVMML